LTQVSDFITEWAALLWVVLSLDIPVNNSCIPTCVCSHWQNRRCAWGRLWQKLPITNFTSNSIIF